ncbi:MAG TPA: NADH-quinone oxidoreductase subunit A [Candidatus Dormibacteraeota bacterium]|nr:NADH-quinone oxidoreductase subunit A [Candidatus Dormibacteraeota bacterium]
MLSDYFPLLIFVAAVFILGLIVLFLPSWIAGSRRTAAKDLPYESGIVPRSGARRRFAVSFYLTAMLFIIFDVEAIFIYPWAVILKGLLWFGVIEMAVFVAVLLVALVYVWRKGALQWGN